ncbi:MAG: hypothetical protein AN484_24430 [Aphanizomenon flos-aquae WA102]|uniref:Uncharacterized protein n=1 Tax=Aphanizomenon flos-aquae WA102 TaxID=1710896 RepID=A0A1B7WM87_APHFL|nr:MAG: hypothetical protein AN484_24430 [Aphanizomenon flos-aquae WA102]
MAAPPCPSLPDGRSEDELGVDPTPEDRTGGQFLAVAVMSPADAGAQFRTTADLTGDVQGGAEVTVSVLGRVDRGRGVRKAGVALDHDIAASEADVGAGEGLGAGDLDGRLLQLGAVVDVGRGLEGDVRKGDPGVDFAVGVDLGDAVGGDGADSRGGQALVTDVDFAEGEVAAEADGVSALDGISIEEAAVDRDAAEAGRTVVEGDGSLDEALAVGALDAAEDVLGLPGDGAAEGEILGGSRDRGRSGGSGLLGVAACDEDGEGESGEGVFHIDDR